MSILAIDACRSDRQVAIEFGHFYSVRGPSMWSQVGLEILDGMKKNGDKTILFVDDVHGIEDVNEKERDLPRVQFDPEYDFMIMESELVYEAFKALDILKALGKRKRARLNGSGAKRWYCSGIPLTHPNGYPTCTLLDVGLTLRKIDMGFTHAINVLPSFYEEQQRGVLRLVEKITEKLGIEFQLEVVLFTLNGHYRRMSV